MIDTRVRITGAFVTAVLLTALSALDADVAADEVRAWGFERPLLTVPSGLKDVRRVVTGLSCTVALREDGSLIGWGTLNGSPIEIPPELGPVADVALTANHVAVACIDGSVVCWGQNMVGQCDVPAQLPAVQQVGAGEYFTLALCADGTLRKWPVPPGEAPIPTGNDLVKIAVASYGFLALRSNGTVVSWGNTTNPPSDLSGVVDISCTPGMGLALKSDGTVVQWSRAPNPGYPAATPPPAGLTGVKSVHCAEKTVSSQYYRCSAVREDGTAVHWTNSTTAEFPTGPISALSMSRDHGAVVRPDGSVTMVGAKKPRIHAAPSELGPDVRQVVAGDKYSFAVRDDGSVVQWGDADYDHPVPPPPGTIVTGGIGCAYPNIPFAAVDGGRLLSWDCFEQSQLCPIPADLGEVVQFAVGPSHAVVLQVDGTVRAFGFDYGGALDVPAGLVGVTQVAAGRHHSLALRSDGSVVPWGINDFGQNAVPSDLGVVKQVDCGWATNNVLLENGTVRCWGQSWLGECAVPAGLTDVVQLSSSYVFTVALRANGTVVAWGHSPNGETNVPSALRHVRSVHAGYTHSLAIVDDSCVGDLDRDGAVMGADLGVLLTQWGQVGAPRGDINADGVVDSIDLGFLIGQWGPCPE